ncbi:MAG: methyl-accepting chemotaxis protein, partial [Alphaproteobacteria bacterium]|nr:methyl-accepting chemotaxis protein [Alphaproteobacteria bacterium]
MVSLSNVKISKKLPVIMVLMALLGVGVSTGISAYLSTQSALKRAEASLSTVLDEKEHELNAYLKTLDDDLNVVATSENTQTAFADYGTAWDELTANQTEKLQKLYIEDNPNPTGHKEDLDYARDGSAYSLAHAKHHLWFRQFLRANGYYDIFLISPEGNILYTVFKELDFATNVQNGQWKNADIGNIFREVMAKAKAKSDDTIVFEDFKPYAPSHDVPAGFIGRAVYTPSGALLGVLVFQLPIDNFIHLLKPNKNLGDTAKFYLTAGDRLLRNDPDGASADPILRDKIDLPAVDSAVNDDQAGVALDHNDKGVKLVTAYEPVAYPRVKWVLLLNQDYDEVMSVIVKDTMNVIYISIVVLLAVALISALFARSLTRPIAGLQKAMADLAGGNKSIAIPGLERGDEIGDMAKTVGVFKENALELDRMNASAEEQKKRAEIEKKETMHKMANDFDNRVGGVIRTLSSAAESMTTTAQQMKHASDQTAHVSSMVASGATQADSNVQTVAAAAEELAASSSEIARQIDSVAKKANMAASDAQATSASVQELVTLAESIGEVIGTIKDIADQTNLLAL